MLGRTHGQWATPITFGLKMAVFTSELKRHRDRLIELKPRIISYLIGLHNLTTRRIEIFNKADYGLTSLKMCKIYKNVLKSIK